MGRNRLVCVGCILVGIFISSCGQTPEKTYSKILSNHGKTISNCVKANDQEFKATVDALRRLLDKYPSWKKAAETQLMIGTMYLQRQEFDHAREDLEKVFLYYTQNQELSSRAMFLRGITYEKQNNIKDAAKEYFELMKRYPTTTSGLGVPLRIAVLYKQSNLDEESRRAYNNAAMHYIRMLEYNPNSSMVGAVYQYLLSAYADTDQWDEAMSALSRLANKYPETNCGALALYNTAMLYQTRFNHPDKAIETFRGIVKAYAKSGIAKQATLDLIRVQAQKGDMEAARKQLGELIHQYPKETSLCAAGHFALAAGYENGNQWSKALETHRQLQSAYAGTLECMRSYIAVGYHYNKLNQAQEAVKVFDSAVACGKGIIDMSHDKPSIVEAYKLISTVYSMQRKWHDGVAILGEFTEKYPDEPETVGALFQMGTIYYAELKNMTKATDCFTKIIQDYQGDNISLVAKNMLEKIQTVSH